MIRRLTALQFEQVQLAEYMYKETKIVFFAGARVLYGEAALNLTDEGKEVQDAVENTYRYHQDKLKVAEIVHDTKLKDFSDKMFEHAPQIIHFAGHGVDRELRLPNADGSVIAFTPKQAKDLLVSQRHRVRLLVLTACSSRSMARELAEGDVVNYAVGTKGRLEESLAKKFARHFYSNLGKRRRVEAAFELTKLELSSEISGFPFELFRASSATDEQLFAGASPLEVVKKYGAELVAFVAVIFSVILVFTDSLRLDTRSVCVGACDFITVAAFSLLLSKQRQRLNTLPMAFRCLLLVVPSWASVKSLELAMAYHNVRVFRHISSLSPNVGSIEFQPARSPVELTISVWVPQTEGVRIEKLSADSWNQEVPLNQPIHRNQTQFGQTLKLSGFKAPQVFGIRYQLNASADRLNWQASPMPDRVGVLDQGRLRRYGLKSYVYGGFLWVFGVLYSLSRWFWWVKPPA